MFQKKTFKYFPVTFTYKFKILLSLRHIRKLKKGNIIFLQKNLTNIHIRTYFDYYHEFFC